MAEQKDGILKAPWTPAEVDALNRYQSSGFVHEFTCGGDHDGNRVLFATTEGWRCPTCGYRQDWAHSAMLVAPRDPFDALNWRRPRDGEPEGAIG
jgi:hypothetical protein